MESQMPPPQYKHTQIGYFLLVVLGSALIMLIVLVLRTNVPVPGIIAIGILACCLLIFSSLTITITNTALEFFFSGHVMHKRLPLADIRTYQIVKNPWYYAWGIHAMPGGWVYNVSGSDALEITLRNGRKYRIGTDDSTQLLATLNDITTRTSFQ